MQQLTQPIQQTTSVATADATYTAKFDTVYTETYNNVIKLLAALTEADTPVEKHAAVNAMDAAYKALSQAQISDMKAEGVSFALYEEMLSKIYTVTFVVEGKTINTVILYEGEEIIAPESPSKQGNSIKTYNGNSIKTYNFVGWFNGENKLETTSVATADATYTAEFAIQYIENYIELRNALDTLANISNGTLEQKYEALTSVYYSLESISEIQKAEAEAEGLSFELYETMLAEYNGIAADAAEDIEKAVNIADGLMDGLASLFLFAAAAYVASKEVIL